ncbi:quinoprotein relay system zinc metallohydrolase 2 [Pseudaminobacter salicylatoxidans]|uniref:quinoprotein relay system zinc metallohydrolase 2 n=1 Tax=Pseudaminobacter salicylatoxidans TaxID=93369 RepID=UPI001FCB14A1|nr:quinoprotein relay system zinc metallohydrolase 2 [Pseudaminobacter salicylatoxidans]
MTALKDLVFEVRRDEFACLVGPSGCGKTTTLRILLGLDTDFSGSFQLPRNEDSRIAAVFQEPILLPWRTVEQNVRLALPKDMRDTDLTPLFDSLGLSQMRSLYPSELSLGLARRVAVARAFAIEPAMLFLDEPFVSLDEQTAERLRYLVLAVWSARPTTALMVTHNVREALMLSDRIILLSARPAHVLGYFDIRIPRETPQPAGNERSCPLLPAKISRHHARGTRPAMRISPTRRQIVKGFACIGAGAAFAPCCRGSWTRAMAAGREMKLIEIADGVHAFSGAYELMSPANEGAICNLGLIVGNEAAAIVDSGGSIVEAQAFLAAIREITDRPIRYLVNTHMHPDHIFGNAVFRDAGAIIVGHHNLPRALEARGDFYLQSYREQLGDELMKGIEIIPPSMLVDERLELDLGGRKIMLRAWKPAHTDNDLTAYDATTKTLFAGDLVFLGHLPTIDGSLLGWMRQMKELAAVEADRVVPGHGPASARWPDALQPQERYFEALAADLRKAIAAGIPLSEAVKTAGQDDRDDWSLFDDFNGRNATAAYAELEWE